MDSLERYLERIGHNGAYSNSTHNCSCANNGAVASLPISVRSSNYVKATAVKSKPSTVVIKTGTPVGGGQTKDAVVANPVFREGMSPDDYGVVSPDIIANSDVYSVEPQTSLDAVLANLDITANPITQTGISSEEVGANVTSIDQLKRESNSPIKSETEPQNQVAITAAKNKKAGKWFIGLLVASVVARQFMKSANKKE